MKVQQDQSVAEGFVLDEDDDGEPVLRVRVGTVVGERELMLLATLLIPFGPQILRVAAKALQVL